MTHLQSLPYARGSQRPTYNYAQVMTELGCCKRHVYNLFDRGDLQGFFMGAGKGLRIYVDSVDAYKQRKSDPHI